MRILIVGAGVIGLSSAYYLQRAGHEVTVLERHPAVARETSFGNGGQLSYSYVAPLADPGVISKLPGWLLRRDSPVRFRPTLNPAQWRWCFAFLAACTRSRSALTTRQLLSLSFLSRTLLHEMIAAEPSLDFDFVRSGKLVLHRDPGAMQQAVAQLELQRALGCEQRALDAAACVALEPSLAPHRDQFAGGIHTPSEDTADCHRFCTGLAALLRARGVTITTGVALDGLRVAGDARDARVVALRDGSPIDADQIVIAAGASAAPLLAPLGIRPPIWPLKGYSLTYALPTGAPAPRASLTDFARKVVYARLGGRLRVAGIADLDASPEPDPARLATLHAQARALFPELTAGEPLAWTGQRPATPTGVPTIGPTRYRNLWLNLGHGALGFTLAAGSAALLADWLAGGTGHPLRETFSH
ncbi:D-amino acid dehydrogenase [Burkholderia plantarii]|uniref:D-amino acid dehydrogenase n=1 Tax=Burkholderia plantarii TaxID=41899 RepID=UPI0006D8C235|nr:D-amino acid dehydrogenase [Burkholderia plantarii]ALK29473.1 D-amino-acid dehydrogenase [Burkholderia plantarii]GLZ21792.1 D-amino-acid dehydrogenase [Burkholderia plantarii]